MKKRHVLLFDSDCPLCTFQSRFLSWLDWCGVVEMVPLKDARAAARFPRLKLRKRARFFQYANNHAFPFKDA